MKLKSSWQNLNVQWNKTDCSWEQDFDTEIPKHLEEYCNNCQLYYTDDYQIANKERNNFENNKKRFNISYIEDIKYMQTDFDAWLQIRIWFHTKNDLDMFKLTYISPFLDQGNIVIE